MSSPNGIGDPLHDAVSADLTVRKLMIRCVSDKDSKRSAWERGEPMTCTLPTKCSSIELLVIHAPDRKSMTSRYKMVISLYLSPSLPDMKTGNDVEAAYFSREVRRRMCLSGCYEQSRCLQGTNDETDRRVSNSEVPLAEESTQRTHEPMVLHLLELFVKTRHTAM